MKNIIDLNLERLKEIDKFSRAHKAYTLELFLIEKEFGALYLQNHQLRIKAFGKPSPSPLPIKKIPKKFLDKFTMGRKIPITYSYRDESYPSNHPYIYTDEQINYLIKMQEDGHEFYYGMLDQHIISALKKYNVAGKKILNIGSVTPWYDALCIRSGVKPTTVDYNKIISYSERTTTLTLEELRSSNLVFDFVLSISSVEHDGLGGYGDPINPDGDLKSMKEMKKFVRPGGIMFLNVPIGEDRVIFNRERVYGKLRLPKLLDEWELIDSFGYDQDVLEGKHPGPPLLILKNI